MATTKVKLPKPKKKKKYSDYNNTIVQNKSIKLLMKPLITKGNPI